MGLGRLHECYCQWFDPEINNATLGIHGQQWLSTPDQEGKRHTINSLFIGVFFFRIVFEFIQ